MIQDTEAAGLSLSSINSFDKEFISRNIKVQPPFAVELMSYVLHSYDLARRDGGVPADVKPTEWTADLLNATIQVETAKIDGRLREDLSSGLSARVVQFEALPSPEV